MSDDELRRRLDRLAAGAPTSEDGRQPTLAAARRRARLGLAVAGVAGAAAIVIGVLAVNVAIERPRPPAPSVAGPAPTGTARPVPTQSAAPPADPSGTLAFWSDSPAGGSATLTRIDADGDGRRTVGDLSISTSRLSLSPDGANAVFNHGLEAGAGQLEVVNMHTGASLPMFTVGNPQDPDWSSDGTIVFSTDSGALFTVPVEGAPSGTPVTASGSQEPIAGLFPSWAPDGRELAYVDPGGTLWITPAGSASRPREIDVPGSASWVDWSDAGMVVATSDGGDLNLFLVDPDGADPPRKLADQAGDQMSPALSPDGRFVAFVGNADSQLDLYLLRIEDGIITRLTNDRRQELSPVWSPLS